MRTRTLLLTAAAMAAGLATSVAQSNVYSVNVVGYYNVPLQGGFQMVANQLDWDGTGTNNDVFTVFSNNLPSGSTVFAFANGAFLPSANYGRAGWGGDTNAVKVGMQPGNGVFLQAGSAKTITLVGNVIQGTLSNSIPTGYNIKASMVPQAGQVQTDLGYTPTTGTTIFRYNPTNHQYLPSYSYGRAGWTPSQPRADVGESLWVQPGSAGSWVRTFTVGP